MKFKLGFPCSLRPENPALSTREGIAKARDASVNEMQEPVDRSKSSPEKASCLQTDLQVVRGIKKNKNLPSYSFRRHSKQPKDKSLYTVQHGAKIPECSIRGGRVRASSAQDGTRGTGQRGAGIMRKTPSLLCPCC